MHNIWFYVLTVVSFCLNSAEGSGEAYSIGRLRRRRPSVRNFKRLLL